MRLARRRLLQAGVAGAAMLAATRLVDRSFAQGPLAPLRFLDARGVDIVRSLAPVVLEGVMPREASLRETAVREVVEAFDRAVSRLGPATREEVAELMSLLSFAPTRMFLAGVGEPWASASPQSIAAFLDDWRTSALALKRTGYRALTQLIQAAWFDNPSAWPLIGYPGPPPLAGRS